MFTDSMFSLYVFLGLFVLCKTQHQNLLYNRQEVHMKEEKPFQCYDCNSEYDPRCGSPFSNYSIGIINCTQRDIPEHLIDPLHIDRKMEPVLCRKIVQKVEGKVRIIRGCGYIRDYHDDKACFRRTGTSAVEVIYCACTTSLCNFGQSLQRPSLRIITAAAATVFVVKILLSNLS